MTRQSLLALRERVRAASGADREIDIAIHYASGYVPTNNDRLSESMRRGHMETFSPPYTASVDAALALVEKLRPDLPHIKMEHFSDGWYVDLAQTASDLKPFRGNQFKSLPLAVLHALLSALIDQAGAPDA